MKSHTFIMCAVVLHLVAPAHASGGSATNDAPQGNISADAALVRAGNYPKLTWNINYPAISEEILVITPEGQVQAQKDLQMQVRIIAADVQTKSTYYDSRKRKYVTDIWYEDVTSYMRLEGKSWVHLFTGTQPEVNSNTVIRTESLKDGDKVYFAAKGDYSGAPGWFYSGYGPSSNVTVLKKGDTPPAYATWASQSTLKTHISPYLDSNGKVDIGPRDVIVAFEVTHVMPSSDGDMQDMIILLTFL